MSATRLSDRSLAGLPAHVRRPAYDRSTVTSGIVHLGIGAFHRAHQAVYTDDVLAAGDLGWGIVGASLRNPGTRDALEPQDCLYGLNVRDGSSESVRIIGSIQRVMVAADDPAALLDVMSNPAIRIVSLTVTEKGYCHSPATGELDVAHPDILHDLAHPDRPRSAPGLLVEASRRRREQGVRPFTILSCDNLPSNGRTVKKVLSAFAALRDGGLGRHVAEDVSCPCTMVDRIVPATAQEDRERVASLIGQSDAWPVIAEPFTQWVVEDDFPAGRPDWPGVTFVPDVEPYEFLKLRLLNGSHSALAYLGYLSGCETVADAMGRPELARFVTEMMDEEVTPTLPALASFDLADYKASLLDRFRNPALRHRTWQIAMDGSTKLPQRLLGTIRDRLQGGHSCPRLILSVAAWMGYVSGRTETGQIIDVRDPLADELRTLAEHVNFDPDRTVRAYLDLTKIFGHDLRSDAIFVEQCCRALRSLRRRGVAGALSSSLQSGGNLTAERPRAAERHLRVHGASLSGLGW